MKQFFMFLGFLSLLSLETQAIKLHLLSNHNNAGDLNQALGIAAAFEKLSNEKILIENINTKITSPREIKTRIEHDLLQGKVIVVGAGEGGIEGTKYLVQNPYLIVCLTSHMFLEGYKDKNLLQKVNFIALPAPALPNIKEMLGSKLIITTGVAHNRQPKVADKAYSEWGTKELPPCKTFVGVVLGGDAPTPKKNINFFTEEDASKLAEYISKLPKEYCFLVLNGPRTGKYDANQKEIPTVHRQGHADHITNFFKQKLTKKGVKNVKVFDYQHNTPKNKAWVSPYNSFDLVTGAVRATNGSMIVPGESTSVISEAVDILPPGKVLVYRNNAMNEIHEAQVANELAAGRISVLENYSKVTSPPNDSQPKSSAAVVIAQKLWDIIHHE